MSWAVCLGMRSPKHKVPISPHCWNLIYNISQVGCTWKQGRVEKGQAEPSYDSTHSMNNAI